MTGRMVHMMHLILIVAAICYRSALASDNVEIKILPAPSVTYKITVLTTASSSSCDKEFLGVTIDSYAVRHQWSGFNFSSTKLQNIARALTPIDLRLGGTLADYLIFHPGATAVHDEMTRQSYTNFTMSGHQWDELTTFVQKVGWNLIFDFNVFLSSHGVWDPSNANQLLEYSAAKGVHISGFQLGNEPDRYKSAFNKDITASDLVRDFRILKKLISNYTLYKGSHLFGPGVTNGALHVHQYLDQFIQAGGADVVNEIGFHHYYMNGATAKLQDFLNITTLNSLKNALNLVVNVTRGAHRPVRVRLSETSSCYGGGAPNLSNAYVAGFLWLDKLGISAEYGLSRVFRQDFIGGPYELVSPKSFTPNPDYYLSVLFKRLIEGPVFTITSTPALGNVRVYANCARRDVFHYPPGALVLYYLNVGTDKEILSLPQFSNEDREVFLLTPGDEHGLTSRLVKLNGQILAMSGNNVPQMLPAHHRGDITVDAHSFGFIVVPQANVPACVKGHTK